MTFRDRADYIRQTFAPESNAMQAARAEGDISIAPETGRFLQLLIRLGNVKKAVEIGTLSGYSALWIAGALPEGGTITTIEKDPQRAAIARRHIAGHPKIRLVEGDALKILPTLESEGLFDLAFIDADKLNYEHYLDWAEANVRKGGLIIGDNTFLFDAVWKDGPVERVRETARAAMRAFNARLSDPGKYTAVMLDAPEGLTVAVKEF